LHSPFPHARIKRIDTRRAEKLEGVVAVVTGKDAPTPYGILPVGHDEHALAVDKVRYMGDNVACVAAIDETTADQALELIDGDCVPCRSCPGEDNLHARRGVLGTPRASENNHRSENWRHERRTHYRRQSTSSAGRRSILLLRRGDDSLFRRVAGGTL